MIEVIPSLDLLGGKCVRLTQGDYGRGREYDMEPLEAARRFADSGVRRLHVVDLEGARAGHIVQHRILERLAGCTSLIIDFGGGIQSDADVEKAFESGAAMVIGGSVAVRKPEVFASWLGRYGSERIILGADCRNDRIAVGGWMEETDEEVVGFIAGWQERGVGQVICTDIERDGELAGANVGLYERIKAKAPSVHLTASGGVGGVGDIEALEGAGVPAVIVGKALYEGRIRMSDLSRYV